MCVLMPCKLRNGFNCTPQRIHLSRSNKMFAQHLHPMTRGGQRDDPSCALSDLSVHNMCAYVAFSCRIAAVCAEILRMCAHSKIVPLFFFSICEHEKCTDTHAPHCASVFGAWGFGLQRAVDGRTAGMNGSLPPAKSRQSHGGRFAAFGPREESSYQRRGTSLRTDRQTDRK